MKKTILALLVAVTLIMGVFAFSVFGEEGTESTFAVYTAEDGTRQYCICGNKYVTDANGTIAYVNGEDGCKNQKDADGNVIQGCDGTLHSFLPWEETTTLPTGSDQTEAVYHYYYLTGKVTLSSQQNVQTYNHVALDLNGQTIENTTGKRIYTTMDLNTSLNILDTSAEKTGLIVGSGTNTDHSFGLWARNGTVNFFSGTVDMTGLAIEKYGCGVSVNSTATFNMFDGTIKGGQAGTYGATVSINPGGTFNLFDGKIYGGKTPTNCGGAIYVNTGTNGVGAFNMYGGTVYGGEAKTGAAIYVKASGTSSDVAYDAAIANLYGGTVYNGTASGNGNGIYDAGALTVGGDVVIEQIYVGSGKTITVDGLTGSVGLASTNKGSTLATAASAEEAACFHSVQSGYTVKVGSAYQIVLDDHAEHCVCGGNYTHTCENENWTPWGLTSAEKKAFPTTAGNYYLVSNLTLTDAKTVPVDTEVKLCLNGYSISSNNRINNKGTLHITDCAETWGTISSTRTGTFGGLLYLYENSVTHLYAGTWDASGTGVAQGAVANVGNSAAATLNIYNGHYIGGTLTMDNLGTATSPTHTRGGAFSVIASSTINMYGGTIEGGSNATYGGAVALWNGCKLNMYGGTITGGAANADESAMGNQTETLGGSIYVAATAKLVVDGGTITGGTTTGTGNGIYVCDTDRITVKGNSVIDEIYLEDGYAIDATGLTGSVGIKAVTEDSVIATVAAKEEAACITSLVEGWKVKTVKTEDGYNVILNSKADYCACGGHAVGMQGHTCENVSWTPWGLTDAEKASLPGLEGNYYLVADITVTEVQTVAVGETVNIDLNGYDIFGDAARIFAVRGDLSVTDTGAEADWGTISSTNATKATGGIFYMYNNASLTIYAGNWDASQVQIAQGGIGVVGSSEPACLNIYGGNFTGADLVAKADGNTDTRGGAFYVIAGSTLNMYGGTVTGGSSLKHGGAIYLNDGNTVNIYGGTITGAHAASNGGAIYNVGTLNIYGGTISDCSAVANGGVLCSSNTIHISGGTISGGSAKNGGNIYSNDTLTISGGSVYGGTASNNGGNIWASGSFTLSAGSIYDGIATADPVYEDGEYKAMNAGVAGNVYVGGGGDFTMTGGNIYNGVINGNTGANIFVYGLSGTNESIVSITGGYIWGGTLNANGDATGTAALNASGDLMGGSIFFSTSGSYTIGGTAVIGMDDQGNVSGSTATYGGNIFLYEGELNITGGTITGGTATSSGGNIAMYKSADAVLNISGGTISDGTSTSAGGNISVRPNGVCNITGGTITGGSAATHGGNIVVFGKLNVSGGTITEGKVSATGSSNGGGNVSVWANGAKLTMTGGTVSNGASTNAAGTANGANILVYSASTNTCTASITGGTVEGFGEGNIADASINVLGNASKLVTLTIGGDAVLSDGVKLSGNSNVTLSGDPKIELLRIVNSNANLNIDASGLNCTTPIPVNAAKTPGKLATSTVDVSSSFVSNDPLKEIVYDAETQEVIIDWVQQEHVYVDATNGNDDNLGQESAPVKTIARAMNAVKDGGTIHLVGTVNLSSWSEHGKSFTITGGELVFPETRANVWDNVTFESVTITMPMCTTETSSNFGSYFFYCNGFKTVFAQSATIRYLYNGTYMDDPYHTVTQTLSDGTTKELTGTSTLYGGGPSSAGVLTGTDLTVMTGHWGNIYGGSNGVDIDGDVHLTVGGLVNDGVDYISHTHSSWHVILGGSRAADISGTIYMNVTGGNNHTSTHGGSNGECSVGAIELRVTGGNGMAIYGGGRGGVNTVGTVNFYYEGGTFEQVFGGTLSNCLTGDVNLYVTGGKITRRLYGGCYSNCSESTGEWTADNFVTGDVNLYIGSGANISCDLKDPDAGWESLITGGYYADRGIYGHSRRAAPDASDVENSRIIFLDYAAYTANKDNLTAQDSIMANIMKGVTAADYICYLGINASGNVITVGATEVEDNASNALDLASGTATITVPEGTYIYEGTALTPAQVTYSDNWTYGELPVTYTGNDKAGTATASITYEGATASTTFTIEEKPCEHTNTTTAYAQVEGTETHTITVTCECGEQISQITENCTDENKDYQCDICGGAVPCKHTNTTTAYAQVEGTETHTITVTCECGEVMSQTTENCTDENKDYLCDTCGGAVPCKHNNTTTAYAQVEGTETHTITVTCECGEQISQVTEDCADNDNNFACDVCNGKLVNAYADSVIIAEELTGNVTVNESTVTLAASGLIQYLPAQGNGAVGNWFGFKLTAPAGVDMSGVTILRPDDVKRNMQAIADGDNFAYLYWNVANGQPVTYQVDWNSDDIYDLSIILDVSGAELACVQVGTTQYASLEAAIAANDGAVKLLKDVAEELTLTQEAYIDLNGFNLSSITVGEGGKLQMIDTATDDYEGAYGTAAVTGTVESFVEYGGKTYLVVAEDGKYSAHCYEVKLTHVSLKPSDDALGYKAQLLGDEVVLKNVKSFGFNLSVAGGASNTYTKVVDGEFDGIFTLRLKGILAANGGEMSITGSAFVIFNTEDKTVTTDEHTTTMKQTLETVNANFESYTADQQTAVKELVTKYASKVSGWNLDKILPEE